MSKPTQNAIAEVTGKVWKIVAPVGTKVEEGDPIVILESMKMEIPVVAPCAGTVVEIRFGEGEGVEEGEVVSTVS